MKNKPALGGVLKKIESLGWVFFLVIFYVAGRRFSDVSPLLMPSLAEIGSALWTGVKSGDLIIQAFSSIFLIMAALLVSTLFSFVLVLISRVGTRAGQSSVGAGFVKSLVALFHPLPGIALLPLVILWIGTGINAVFFILIHSILWPLTTNLLSGFDKIPMIYYQIGNNYQMSRWQLFRSIELPSTSPMLMAGWRIGWARGWRALISAEMVFGSLGGRGGMGWYLFQRRVYMDTPGIYAGLVVIIFFGLAMEGGFFKVLERSNVIKWGGRS